MSAIDDAIEARHSIEATYSPVDGACALCLIGFSDADLMVTTKESV